MDKINYKLVEELSSDVDILLQLIKTSSAIAGFSGTSQIIPNKSILINTLGIQESRSSSAIENIFTTNSDVYESMALGEKSTNVNAKEVINYTNAVIEASNYIKNRPITRSLLEEVQGIVEPTKKGIRKTQVHIGNPVTGEIVHMPPSTNEIEDLLDDLVKFINIDFNDSNINPLVNVIVSHHQFESIHPFLDGNGRTGRILIITQLLNYGYLTEPILYLSRYINNTKSEYYKHLQAIRGDGCFEEWKTFVLYYLKAMEEISNQSSQLVNDIYDLINETKVQLLEVKFKRNADSRLIDLLFSHPYFTREKYEKYLGVKRNPATDDIAKLMQYGFIEREEKSQKTYYINKKLEQLLENVNTGK